MGADQDATRPSGASEPDALTAQLRDSLESMPDGFVLLGPDLRLLYVNAKAERILARSRTEMVGRELWEVFPEGRGSRAEAEYDRVLREGGSTTFEVGGGDRALIEVRAHLTTSGGIGVYLRDVTKARATQELARLLQAAVSRLGDIVLITEAATQETPEPGIVFANEAFTRLTGYTFEEVQGRSPQFMRGPLTDTALIEWMRQKLSNGRPARGELVYYAKDGRELWVDIQLSPFRAPNGEATHIVIVSRDISERRRAERALRESIERFRIIAKATADVVWDWNLLTDTIWWGDGMRTRFGYAYDDTAQIGESWVRHIHPEDRERVVSGIHDVIESGGEIWTDDYRFLRADGSVAEVADRGFVIRDERGAAVRMVGSIIDVTEQRELEAQLRQSQRLEAVGQLTGGVAHDFNNLLTVILSNAELLETRLAGQDQLHMLAEMTRMAAERGAELTSRLLAFSRRQALDPTPTDIAALVRGMEGLIKRAVGEQVEVRVAPAGGVWPALIDKLQLETAMLNLCINARDATPGGGVLQIELSNVAGDAEVGDCVRVCVRDNGAGMDEATRARVFEPFFTTKDVGKGSGLGLSMVYGFVTQSKGRVEIDTALGEGTAVKLYLPRAAQAAAARDIGPIAEALSGDERVLVVEDDDLVRAQVASELVGLGYRVVTARNALEAMEMLCAGEPFDLLFTDVVMPGGVNGRQLADAVREMLPRLPVLYTTGNPDIVMGGNGGLAAGTHLLRKPYRRRELAIKLREALADR